MPVAAGAEKQIGYDLDTLSDPVGKNITVAELVERYLATKTGVKPNTLTILASDIICQGYRPYMPASAN